MTSNDAQVLVARALEMATENRVRLLKKLLNDVLERHGLCVEENEAEIEAIAARAVPVLAERAQRTFEEDLTFWLKNRE